MRPSTHRAISHERLESVNGSDVQMITMPKGTSAVEFAFETTAGRLTYDGSDPSAANAASLVYPSGQVPVFRPIGPGTTLKYCSTAATSSVLQIAYYT